MKKNRIPSEADRRTIRAGRCYGALVLTVLACAAMTCPALAADDPLTIVGNLSDFIFSIIKALGVIILGWGMLILVALIKGAERIAKETFGL